MEEIETKTEEKPKLIYGKAIELDKKDVEILKILDRNARLPISKISRKVGLSRDAIKYRIEKLIKNKVILKFTTVVNPPKFGFENISWVFIALGNVTEKKENEFIQFLTAHPNITYVASVGGRWDYKIEITARNPGHYDEILKSVRRKFSDIIKECESVPLLKEYKMSYFPYSEL